MQKSIENHVYGAPMSGGFFAGAILVDGLKYAVIVSPKATGETTGKWGEYGEKIAAGHLSDGITNTKAMAEAGSTIAQWALALNINGHADWYIPSREELELLYRNLKPTVCENSCSYRDGENLCSVPLGFPYADDLPAQTSVADFQECGGEALAGVWHWTSTQYSSYGAFYQLFNDGGQGSFSKGYEGRVRAVRRELIP
jgi:hypothetical protein